MFSVKTKVIPLTRGTIGTISEYSESNFAIYQERTKLKNCQVNTAHALRELLM